MARCVQQAVDGEFEEFSMESESRGTVVVGRIALREFSDAHVNIATGILCIQELAGNSTIDSRSGRGWATQAGR